MSAHLTLTRAQILAFRRRVGGLGERADRTTGALRQAAWAGLQDSMPRAAILSIHARVADTDPSVLGDPALVQIWGPRYSAYVIAADDLAVFSLGRLPEGGKALQRAEDTATRLADALGGRPATVDDAGRAVGVHPNALRYAAPTGTVLIRWDGARQPRVWTVPRPDVDPADARLELARRFLHVFGPGTAASFGEWAGVGVAHARAVFAALEPALVPVVAPGGNGWILAADERAFRDDPGPDAPARLLPSGDAYFLLQGADREVLVPDPGRRALLWTSRVWPGAVLADGEVVGTWRRAGATVTVQAWLRLPRRTREAIEAEAASLPLPDLAAAPTVRWAD